MGIGRRFPWRYTRAFVALTLGAILVLPGADSAGSVGPAAPATASTRATPTATASGTAVASSPAPSPSPTVEATPSVSPTPSGSPQTEWALDLYRASGVRRQYPDPFACTAAAVQTSLNLIALDNGDVHWTTTTAYRTQEDILAYERANMTMAASSDGSDPHGTRNALNYFGWGSMDKGVYTDVAEPSFAAASKAVVASIARTRKPAIIFTWFGGHSQIVTGYKAHGQNPATSDDFTIEGVYITDPLEGYTFIVYGGVSYRVDAIRPDTWIPLANWKSGSDSIRFTDYRQTDSRLRDPIDGSIGELEWYGKWVVVMARS
jgi:hypothetical protein